MGAEGNRLGLVTDKEIPKVVARNIEWFHSAYWLEAMEGVCQKDISLCCKLLKKRLCEDHSSIQAIVDQLDKEMNLDGTFLYLLRHLLARKEIIMDLNKKFNILEPINGQIIKIVDEEKEKNVG